MSKDTKPGLSKDLRIKADTYRASRAMLETLMAAYDLTVDELIEVLDDITQDIMAEEMYSGVERRYLGVSSKEHGGFADNE